MDWNIEVEFDDHLGLDLPRVIGTGRPDLVVVESDRTVGYDMSAGDLAASFVRMEGTDLELPRRQAFVAFGGDLPFDVLFIIDFDGRVSTLSEVRFRQRPDRPLSVSTTTMRGIQLQSLVDRALKIRTAFRRVSDNEVRRATTDEERRAYLRATQNGRGESRRRVPDDELRQVAAHYRVASMGRDPTRAVQEALGYPTRDIAKKRVRSARKLGFLEPAPGERRGGIR